MVDINTLAAALDEAERWKHKFNIERLRANELSDAARGMAKAFEELRSITDELQRQNATLRQRVSMLTNENAVLSRMSWGVTEHQQFSETQLRTLIQLCHPDKHGGKASAVEITQHINQLRRK